MRVAGSLASDGRLWPRAGHVRKRRPHQCAHAYTGSLSRDTAQVLIQWNLRHGVAVVPKCSTLDHAAQILDAAPPAAVPLSPVQMRAIDAIGNGANGGPVGRKRFICPPFSALCSDSTPGVRRAR